MTDRYATEPPAKDGRRLPWPRLTRAGGQPSAPLAETFFVGGTDSQVADSGAILRWGLRQYAWLLLLCVAVVGVLLPLQEVHKKPVYSAESVVVAVDLQADTKTLPRLGEALFDDGKVAAAVSQEFGDAGDLEDVVPRRASVLTEQDSLVMHVQGHSRDPQTAADIANVAATAFVGELNKTGSGVGTFAVISKAVPPVERDEPIRARPYSVSVGLIAGLVMGLGLLVLILVLRRPVVEPFGAARATEMPVFGVVTMPRAPAGTAVPPDEVGGLAPVCRQLLDWSPNTVFLTGPDTPGNERRHLAWALGAAFDRVRQLVPPDSDGAEGRTADSDRPAVGLPISVIDGSRPIDLISPDARSFVLLAVPVGTSVGRVRDLAVDLKGVASAIVLTRTRGRRRRQRAGRVVDRKEKSEPHGSRRESMTRPRPAGEMPTVSLAERLVPRQVAAPETAEATEAVRAPAVLEPANREETRYVDSAGDPDDGVRSDPDDVLSWVAANIGKWFPELAADGSGASLRRRDLTARPRCRIHDIEVSGPRAQRAVVVKQRVMDPELRRQERKPNRPILGPDLDGDPGENALVEFEGLVLLYGASVRRSRTAVHPVEPFGFDAGLAAVAMERIDAPTLRDLVRVPTPAPAFPPTAPWANAAAWLRRFHELQPASPVPARRARRADVVDQLRAYGRFLSAVAGRGSQLTAFVDAACAAAERHLPDELRLGLGHGDFVAQNIFVHPDGRVSVIDPFPAQRVPVFEDLGRLIIGARLFESPASRPRYGERDVRARPWEVALLSRYFGTAARVPVGQLRVFLALCTLDKWADSVSKAPTSAARRRLRGSRLAVLNHWYHREVGVQMDLLRPGPWADTWL